MPTKGYRTEAERRRLSMGDVLGLNKLPKLRGSGEGSVKGAPDNWPRKPHGQTRALKNFAPGGLCASKPDSTFEKHNGPGPDAQREFEQTRPNVMSFGEQFVELLGEFVDAREQYAHARRDVGSEYANSDDMDKAGDALQALLDKRFP